jgi:hypothetical protein
MDPFALLDGDQVGFAQAIEALATGDPRRVRAADPEWRKRHACDHPPCWLDEGWTVEHLEAYAYLWPRLVARKVQTTDKYGTPHSSMRYMEDHWVYMSVVTGTASGPYDDRGNSRWPVHDTFRLVDDGTRVSVEDILDLIRLQETETLVETTASAPGETPIETPVEAATATALVLWNGGLEGTVEESIDEPGDNPEDEPIEFPMTLIGNVARLLRTELRAGRLEPTGHAQLERAFRDLHPKLIFSTRLFRDARDLLGLVRHRRRSGKATAHRQR